jgi:DNA polymerase IV
VRLRAEGSRGHGRLCRTVVLRLRFADFTRATRSHTLAEATGHTATLLEAARELLRGALPLVEEQGLTLLGLSFSGLCSDTSAQLALPFDKAAEPGLDGALDRVRERFGARSVTRGTLLRAAPHLAVPQLPEDL